MTRPLIVHQLNAVGMSPVDVIRIVGENKCEYVTLFTYNGSAALPSTNAGLSFPLPVTRAMKRDVQNALNDYGVKLAAVEFFPLTDDVDLETYVDAMALGAELGATRVSSHNFVRDDALVVDKLGKLCDLAAKEGMTVSSEMCPLTPGNPSLERGKWLVDQVGSDRFRLGIDVLHVIRSGATIADVAALDPRYFGVVQVNDAFGTHASSNYFADVHKREVPGTADLPVREFIKAVPASMPLEIEVPAAHRRAAGISAEQHVRECVEGTRAILESLETSKATA